MTLKIRALCALTLLTFSAQAFAQETVFEMASPDEVAAELNLPMAEQTDFMVQGSVDNHNVDVTQYWPLVVVINKAATGPTAQTVRVYIEGALVYNWKTSTGRERDENPPGGKKYFSTTPVGWFSPTRLSRDHVSITWEAPMPFAVFFNGGIALHATTPSHFAALGSRDSGGCARLLPANAEILFDLVEKYDHGTVPKFDWTGQISFSKSLFSRKHKINMQNNWNTLIIVEDVSN